MKALSMRLYTCGTLVLLLLLLSSISFAEGIPSSAFSRGAGGSDKFFPKSEVSAIPNYQGTPIYQAIDDSLYEVGPGDVFSVYIEEYHSVAVNPEGFIQIANFKPIHVSFLSLRDAKRKITKTLRSQYNLISTQVSLLRMKHFKVEVVGEVHNPQSFVVDGTMRIVPLLRLTGGFTPLSNRQYVTIQSRDGRTKKVHVGDYQQENGESFNPILQMGDRVIVHRVDFQKPLAKIILPGKDVVFYQQVEQPVSIRQTVAQLQNFQSNMFFNRIKITNKSTSIYDFEEISDYQIQPGDVLEFQRAFGSVYIGGAVSRTTSTPYVPGYTVENYLYKSGVRVETGNLNRYELRRNGQKVSKKEIQVTGVLPGDLIYIDSDIFYHVRDYVGLVASTVSLVISSWTAYTILSR